MRRRLPAGGRWMALLALTVLAAACPARAIPPSAPEPPAPPPATDPASPETLFDTLFGVDPAAERGSRPGATDGLALPSLFAGRQQIADALPFHEAVANRTGGCVALAPLLDALELAHSPSNDAEGAGLSIMLPAPQRTVIIPDAALQPAPGGACLPLEDLPRYLPLSLTHDRVSQQLILAAQAPLPVLMRLERAERQARLHPEAARPVFALQPAPSALARLWSADLALDMVASGDSRDVAAAAVASGELLGLAGRASLRLAGRGAVAAGLTLTQARDTPDLLGPLGARTIAFGDIGVPAQPLIADVLSGRGLVIASRPTWRADLVDEIDLFGPLPPGWEAELWHEDRLVDVTRAADAAGNWRFASLPVRIGENRWIVRLYGPYGETREQVFSRLVGTEMNAENEVDYSFGMIDGGTPLFGAAPNQTPSGAAGFATLGWGVAPSLTARLDLRAPLAGTPALSMGLRGAHAETLWAATLARDSQGGIGAALRMARRIGANDLQLDLARHGRDNGPAQPPLVREFADLMALGGQGRLALGRHSLPWQMRLQSATRRSGGQQQTLAARLALPLASWQASAALGVTRQSANTPRTAADPAQAVWQGNAILGVSGGWGRWRLRGGLDAINDRGWRLGGTTLSAARTSAQGAINLDLGWQANARRLSGGISVNHRLGPLGLSAGIANGQDGWRFGLGLVVGLWQNQGRWHAAPAGLTQSGAVLADMFIDEDGDGARGPDEAGLGGGRVIVGNALRSEASDASGQMLLRALPAGRAVDIETQLASLPDFALRPAHAGDRVALRPGEIRRLPIPVGPTGSIEARILLAAAQNDTPLSGVPALLLDAEGREVARSVSDFEGYVLFEGLAFGPYTVSAGSRAAPPVTLSRAAPDTQLRLRLAPGAP